MPELKPNPCILCGKKPQTWSGSKGCLPDVTCYHDPSKHSICVKGTTLAGAIVNWNRLNPSTSPDGQRGRTPFLQRRRWTLRDLWDLWTKGRP